MNTIQSILKRRSTRDWSDKKVPDEIITQILEAGAHTPSPLNSQPWHFIVVREKSAIKTLMRYARHGTFLSHANAVIVVTVEQKAKVDEWLFEHEQHLYSGACALYGMWLASYEIGLGACWVTVDEARTREILSIPADQKVIGSLAIGYPKDEAHHEASRKSLSEIVSYDKYKRPAKAGDAK